MCVFGSLGDLTEKHAFNWLVSLDGNQKLANVVKESFNLNNTYEDLKRQDLNCKSIQS